MILPGSSRRTTYSVSEKIPSALSVFQEIKAAGRVLLYDLSERSHVSERSHSKTYPAAFYISV